MRFAFSLTLIVFCLEVQAFLVPQSTVVGNRVSSDRQSIVLWDKTDENEESVNPSDDENIFQNRDKLSSVNRVGGRSKYPSMQKRPKKKKPWWALAFVPLVAGWIFFQNLFSPGPSSLDYVYYQSTVFESRVVGSDGRMESARKESVRTNAPTLMERQEREEFQLRPFANNEFDRAFDREMQRMDDFDREIVEWTPIEASFWGARRFDRGLSRCRKCTGVVRDRQTNNKIRDFAAVDHGDAQVG